MKVLSQETNLGIGTTVSGASMVRAYNSDSAVGTVSRKAWVDGVNTTLGSLSIPSQKVVYLEKNFTDTLVAPATVKASKIAYSPVLQFASWNTSTTYDTVTWTQSGGGGPWYYATDSTPHVGGDYSVNFLNVPTVPKAGKRHYVIVNSYRLVYSQAWDNYDNWFKPGSGGGVTTTVTMAGQTPTYSGVGKTKFNGTTIYYGNHDLNSSGSNATVQFDFDATLTAGDDPGGFQVVLFIFDYVEEMGFDYGVKSSDQEIDETTAFNVAPGGSGDGWTSSFKLINAVSSNSETLTWTKGAGESDSSYTVVQEFDIGSDEMIETSYWMNLSDAEASNITGKWAVDSGNADDGLGGIAAHIRFKPSEAS